MEGKKITGTKRSYDELVHIMDMYYKQENDALLVQNRRLMTEIKKTKRSLALKTHVLQISSDRVRVLENELNWARLMMNEIFQRFPNVSAAYEAELETEEEIISDNEI